SRSAVSSPAKTRKRSGFSRAAAAISTISAPAARSGLMMKRTLILSRGLFLSIIRGQGAWPPKNPYWLFAVVWSFLRLGQRQQLLTDNLRRQTRPGGINMNHIVQVFGLRGNQAGQIDDQDPVAAAHLDGGLIKLIVDLLELLGGDLGVGFEAFHGLADLVIRVGLDAVELGHQHRGDSPRPANIDEGLQVHLELIQYPGRIEDDLPAPDVGEFILRVPGLLPEDL